MNKILFGLALLLVGTVAFGQVAEVSVSGGVSRLSNNDLGSGYTLDNGFRLAIRGTFNMGRFLGHEVGYAYKLGMPVANWEWLAFPALSILLWIFVPLYVRSRITTMPESVRVRINRPKPCLSFKIASGS